MAEGGGGELQRISKNTQSIIKSISDSGQYPKEEEIETKTKAKSHFSYLDGQAVWWRLHGTA